MSELYSRLLIISKDLQKSFDDIVKPPETGKRSQKQLVLPLSVVGGTRDYIEKIVYQINGCYENGWYDACAVMAGRLIETLIIEVYEKKGIADKIKNDADDFFQFGDLIKKAVNEKSWNLSRGTKKDLSKIKKLRDQSAHNRYFNAHRRDIEKIIDVLRIAVDEFIKIAELK